MYTSEANRLRAIENQIGEQQKLNWAMLLLGLMIGFLGMYFLVSRPMSREMHAMRADMAKVQEAMELVAAQGEQVWEANSLLSSLKVQQAEIESARQSLQSIQQLQTEVREEADKARLSLSQLEAMSNLNRRVIQEQPSVEIAGRTLDDMVMLQERVAARKDDTISATAVLDQMIDLEDDVCAQASRLDEAGSVVHRMGTLQEELRLQSQQMNDAWFGLHALTTLKNTLLSGAQFVELAQVIGDQLLTMQQKLAEGGTSSESAMQRANQLLELNAALTDDDLDLQSAQKNLKALLELQQMIDHLPSLAKSMESLELFTAFQQEFINQLQITGEMRKSLVEFSLMHTTLARAMKSLEPLLDIGNLQRLSADEMRSAARTILDERASQHPRRAERTESTYESNGVKDAFVPAPRDDE